MTDPPILDWCAIEGAVEYLHDSDLAACAEAIHALEAHDTAATVRIGRLADDATRAAKLLDQWLGWHATENGAELVAAARELLVGGGHA